MPTAQKEGNTKLRKMQNNTCHLRQPPKNGAFRPNSGKTWGPFPFSIFLKEKP